MKFANCMIVTVSTVLVLCAVQTLAIHCFHCHSYHDESCGDPFDGSSNGTSTDVLIDCNTLGGGKNYTYCRKTTQIATLRPDKDTVRVIRSCGFLPEPKLKPVEGDNLATLRCYRRTGTFGVELKYCACHEDGCNSAEWRSAGGMLIIVSAMLSIFNGLH